MIAGGSQEDPILSTGWQRCNAWWAARNPRTPCYQAGPRPGPFSHSPWPGRADGSEAALTLPASEGVYRLLRSSAIVRKTITFHSTSSPHPFSPLSRTTQRSAALFFSYLSSAKAGSFVWLTCNQRRRGKPPRNCQMSHLHMQRRPAAQEQPYGQERCPVWGWNQGPLRPSTRGSIAMESYLQCLWFKYYQAV